MCHPRIHLDVVVVGAAVVGRRRQAEVATGAGGGGHVELGEGEEGTVTLVLFDGPLTVITWLGARSDLTPLSTQLTATRV